MDLEATFSAICKNCGGHCCKGATGVEVTLSKKGETKRVWFFPQKIKGYFYPPEAPLKYRADALRYFIKTLQQDGKLPSCKWHKKGGCPPEDKPDFCKDFYCHGIIDFLEMIVGRA